MHHLKQAFGSLRRSPGFSVLAVATITLGVAANTAIFSMVEGVLLRRLPYGSGDRLIHIQQPSNLQPDVRMSIPEIAELRAQTRTMDAVVEYHAMSFQLYGMGEPQRLQTGVVSDRFFQVLGVAPELGRLFRPGEEDVGAQPMVLLSHEYWTNVMGSNPNVVGAQFTMNDRVHTVIGVLPPMPAYPGKMDIWVPAGACPFRSAPAAMASMTARLPTVIGRLKPGVTVAQANAELATIAQRLHAQHPEAYPVGDGLHWGASSVRDEMTAGSKSLLLILFSTAFFLMIVAAANFAGLTVARQLGRAREIAMREALGATRLSIFAQLASESLMLSISGGLVGTALASSGLGMLRSLATRVTPRAEEIHINGVVLGFAVLTCVVVGLIAAAAPLMRARGGPALVDRLRQGNSGAMSGKVDVRVRRAFVFVQVAIAFVLLVGAGLVGRSLYHLQQVDGGFDPHDVMTARVALNFSKYKSRQTILAFQDRLMQRLEVEPGMKSAAVANSFPLNNAVTSAQAFIIGGVAPNTTAAAPRADFSTVSSRYFATLGIPLKRGRTFAASDRDTAAYPVIVSQRLASAYWGTQDPLGTRISTDSGRTWNPVVGVVGDVRQTGLDKEVSDEIYVPAVAVPPANIRIVVRFQGKASALSASLRRIVHDLDPQQSIDGMQTLDEVRGTHLSEPRLTAALLAVFATVALVLAATGLAGVVGYTVTQRIPEIAVRRALGADRGRIMRLVGRDGLTIVMVGLGAGVSVSLALSRFVRALLFQIQPDDVETYAGVAIVLTVTTILACVGPARRALAADPAKVLRGG